MNILYFVIYHLTPPWTSWTISTLTRQRKSFRRNERRKARLSEEELEAGNRFGELWRIGGWKTGTESHPSQHSLKTTLPTCMIGECHSGSSHLTESLQGHSWCCHNASQCCKEISCTDLWWPPLTWGSLNAKFSWWLAGKHLKKAISIMLSPDPLPAGSLLPLSSLISCHGCISLSKWHYSQHLPYHHPQRQIWVSKENPENVPLFHRG